MASRAFQTIEDIPRYDGFAAEDSCAPAEFFAGERICSAGPPRRRHSVLRTVVAAGFVVASVSAWIEAPDDVKEWLANKIAAAISKTNPPSVEPAEAATNAAAPQSTSEAAASAAPPPMAEARGIAADPAAGAGTPVQTEPSLAPQPAENEDGTADLKPLPPPVVDPADPYQKRALAVGLHPDLSKALLSRLTEADFRNAGLAIKSALAEPAASKVYAWPKEGGGKVALFEVRFVRAAAPECRRYVVTVTKNRWSTTAPAMETCGEQPRFSAAKAAG